MNIFLHTVLITLFSLSLSCLSLAAKPTAPAAKMMKTKSMFKPGEWGHGLQKSKRALSSRFNRLLGEFKTMSQHAKQNGVSNVHKITRRASENEESDEPQWEEYFRWFWKLAPVPVP